MKLRERNQVNYYESEEPPFDEYLYCDRCEDFVYEYCSIHGPLLVIPDDEEKPGLPPVPRAALTIPSEFLHLAPSIIPGAGLGVFTTLTLPRGVRFGPYRGQYLVKAESSYCWQIYGNNRRGTKLVDASDAECSNWMRYVNCARHFREQNLVAYQYRGEIYYRTIKIIPRFTELMVFYGGEFAKLLGINLRYYNTDEFYRQMQETTTTNNLAQSKVSQKHRNEVQNDMDSDFLTSYTHETPQDKEISPRNVGTVQDFVLVDDDYTFDSYEKTDYKDKAFEIECKNGAENNETNTTSRVRLVNCEYCLKTLSHRSLNRHIMSMHPEHSTAAKNQRITCQYCFKTLSPNYSLKKHIMSMHSEHFKSGIVNRFTCEYCSKTLSRNYNLKMHIKSMHPEYSTSGKDNLVVCEYCSKTLSSNYKLKMHIMSMHPEYSTPKKIKRLTCEYCFKTLSDNYSLKRHIKSLHAENSTQKVIKD